MNKKNIGQVVDRLFLEAKTKKMINVINIKRLKAKTKLRYDFMLTRLLKLELWHYKELLRMKCNENDYALLVKTYPSRSL